MGVSRKTLSRLSWLIDHNAIPANAAVLDLGSQNLTGFSGGTGFLRQFIADLRKKAGLPVLEISSADLDAIADDGKVSRLMDLCGFDYHALDIFVDDKVVLFDLNFHDLPARFVGAFNLVTNFGTTEHVFDQVRAFRVIHEATKSGGIVYHDLPMSGYFSHGYFNYTPLFFCQLAAANDYEILFEHYTVGSESISAPLRMIEKGFRKTTYEDAAVEFAFRKTAATPFRLPLNIGAGVDRNVWGDDLPYRIIDKANALLGPPNPSLIRNIRKAVPLLKSRSGRRRLMKRLQTLLPSDS